MNRLYFIVIFTIVFTGLPVCLFAGLHVDPTVLEVVVDKDAPTEQSFILKNTGEKPIQVRIELKKKNKDDIEVSDWFNIDTKAVRLESGVMTQVPYKIDLPKDAEGELRCMVFFVADEIGKQKSFVGIRFGVPVYAIVQNTVKLGAVVDNIKVRYDVVGERLKGIVFVKNESNIHIRPNVDLMVLDDKGKKKTSFEIPFGQPAQIGQTRPFRFSQEMELEPGNYELVASVYYGKMYGKKKLVAEGEGEFEVVEVKEGMKEEKKTTESTENADKSKEKSKTVTTKSQKDESTKENKEEKT